MQRVSSVSMMFISKSEMILPSKKVRKIMLQNITVMNLVTNFSDLVNDKVFFGKRNYLRITSCLKLHNIRLD